MPKTTIAWLATDSAAGELLDNAYRILDLLRPGLDYLTGDIGWEAWKREGTSVPDRTLQLIGQSDCTMLGVSPWAVASAKNLTPQTQHYQDPWNLVARTLRLHTELRPIKAFAGNPLNRVDGMDLVVFRDLLEGLGTGAGFHPLTSEAVAVFTSCPNLEYLSRFPYQEIALNFRIVTRQGIEQVLRQAFEFAQRNHRRGITVVDQPDLFPDTAEIVIQTAREVALEYPALPYQECSFHQIIGDLFQHPMNHDVIVVENVLGDILSRIAVAEVGGIGFLSRVAIGNGQVMLGPVIESSGKPLIPSQMNPYGIFIAVRMLLEFLGEAKMASILGKAIEQVILEGNIAIPEMGGTSSNAEITQSVIDNCQRYLDAVES
jgi:3-isopropylmalate dehydrogenase